jgi:hypothetical protein
MKNNNMHLKLNGEFSEIMASENPSGDVLEKIKITVNAITTRRSRHKTFRLKQMIVAALIFAALVTTIVAAAPHIFVKMLGSDDIGYFSFALMNNNNIRFAGDYDLIKQYSSEVGITAQGKDYSFTVDNIAFDGIFLSIFYTVEKKADVLDELGAFTRKWNGKGQIDIKADERTAVSLNGEIGIKIAGIDLPLYGHEYAAADDGYLASGHETKAMQRFTITDELPDIFDIEIIHFDIFDDKVMGKVSKLKGSEKMMNQLYEILSENMLSVKLTVDKSEINMENSINVCPNLSAKINQNSDGAAHLGYAGQTTEHNVTVEKASISPFGNILVLKEAGANDEKNQFLFNNFFVIDDKGKIYAKSAGAWYRQNPEEEWTFTVEFFGYVPSDAKYIKIVPYDISQRKDICNAVDIENLPSKIKYSDFGDIIIQSVAVSDENITVTYSVEGMVEDRLWLDFGNEIYAYAQTISSYAPIYDRSTDLYTVTYTFKTPVKNARDIIKSIKLPQYEVALLDDQAIVIPLK